MSFPIRERVYQGRIVSFFVILGFGVMCLGLFSPETADAEESMKQMLLRVKSAVVFVISGMFGQVVENSDAGLSLLPVQPDILKLQCSTQGNVARGFASPAWEKEVLYAGSALVFIIVVMILAVVLIKKGRRKKPTPGTRGGDAVDGALEMVSTPLGTLEAKGGVNAGGIFEIHKAGLKIGRDAAQCDIVIDNPHVSWEHAWVGEEGGSIVLKDLNSANGVFVNVLSRRVASEALQNGDLVIIGKGKMASFVYKEV